MLDGVAKFVINTINGRPQPNPDSLLSTIDV